jgi:hypothetical protein
MNNGISSVTRFESSITPTAGAAGTTAINGSIIDTKGAQGVLFLTRFGAITAGAATSIKLQHGDAANLSDAADVAGSNQTVADTDDGKLFVTDYRKPQKRYVRLVVSRATQNAVVATSEALAYNLTSNPPTQPADVGGLEQLVGKSGTA